MDKILICNRAIQFRNDLAFLARRAPEATVRPAVRREFSRLKRDALEAFGSGHGLDRTPEFHETTTHSEAIFAAAGLAGIVQSIAREEFEASMIPLAEARHAA